MLNEKLAQALDGISDEKLESAMGVYERRQRRKMVRLRVATCAAVVALLFWGVLFAGSRKNGSPLFLGLARASGNDVVRIIKPSNRTMIAFIDDSIPEDDPFGDLFLSAPPTDGKPKVHNKFLFGICPVKELDYHKVRVFRDGEELSSKDQWETDGSLTSNYYQLKPYYPGINQRGQIELYQYGCYIEEKTIFIIEYLDEENTVILRCMVSVTPLENVSILDKNTTREEIQLLIDGYHIKLEDSEIP